MVRVSYYADCDRCGKALAVTSDSDNLIQRVKGNGRLVTEHGKFFCDWNCLHQWIDDNKELALEAL